MVSGSILKRRSGADEDVFVGLETKSSILYVIR